MQRDGRRRRNVQRVDPPVHLDADTEVRGLEPPTRNARTFEPTTSARRRGAVTARTSTDPDGVSARTVRPAACNTSIPDRCDTRVHGSEKTAPIEVRTARRYSGS